MKKNNILQLFLATAFLLLFSTGLIQAQYWAQLGDDIDGEADWDESGYSVSLNTDGNVVAIGAPWNDGGGTQRGHVRIYENQSGSWIQIGDDIDGEADMDRSGNSVSLNSDGTIIAIGACYNIGGGTTHRGHVRIYENQAGEWIQIGSDIDGEADGDHSGYSVSLNADGTVVAIGAPDNDGGGIYRGHVRIYKNQSGSWTQIGNDIDGEADGDRSGSSISLNADGTVVAIGAPDNGGGGTYHRGHVRIYENQSGSWIQIGSDIDGEADEDCLGRSLSLSANGTVVAIGAPGHEFITNPGRVRIYENQSGVWTQIGNDIDGEVDEGHSGYSVSLNADGTVVSIGAPNNDAGGIGRGDVRIFENQSGVWMPIGILNGEADGDQSGYSVSLNGDGSVVAIGAHFNDGGGVYQGHVRVYLDLQQMQLVEMRYFFNDDPGAGNGHLYAVYDPPVNEIIDEIDIPLIDHADELEEGFNMLYLRFKDAAGNWSLSEGRLFYVLPGEESIPAISELRYFFNTDPGVEHSNNHLYESYDPAVPIVDKTASINLDDHTSEWEEGFNMLYFRFKDENGNWSLSEGRSFYIFNEVLAKPIAAYEWFIDTDPGVGTTGNTTVIDPPVEIFDGVIPIEISGYEPGMYNLFIRVMDEDGNWSLSHSASFEVVRGISLKVFLEGPYIVADMGHQLNVFDMIPFDQPYNLPPWNYSGTESVSEIPPGVVDWVYLEFHDIADPSTATTESVIDEKAAFLLKDGSIVDLDGSSPLMFPIETLTNELYVTVWHRNHLPILSNYALTEVDYIYGYDFSTASDQAYGTDAQISLGASDYGMYGGDANADGTVGFGDKIIWNNEVGRSGYKRADMDLNGQVKNDDKNWVLYPNWDKVSSIPYSK